MRKFPAKDNAKLSSKENENNFQLKIIRKLSAEDNENNFQLKKMENTFS